MRIDVNESGFIRLSEIYNPIELVTDKQRLFIAQKDGIFEIGVVDDVASNTPIKADHGDVESILDTDISHTGFADYV